MAQDIIEPLFPTFLGVSLYPRQEAQKADLLSAVYQIRDQDERGRKVSEADSPVGYTSYFTLVNLYTLEPFMDLANFITEKALNYARYQKFDLENFELVMNTFWINITPRHAYHAEHIHPYSHVSGVYYLSATPDSGDIIFKDPRPVRTMAMPPLAERGPENSDVFTIAPAEGHVLFFPSWLTHGVQQNRTDGDRISLSFNLEMKSKAK